MNIISRGSLSRLAIRHTKRVSWQLLFWLPLGLIGVRWLGLLILLPIIWGFCLPRPALTSPINLWKLGHWNLTGVVLGTLLFAGILLQADPVLAQLFEQAESQAETIFGQYLDQEIISFLFGLLRIVIWVTAIGFVFFAVYQAQRGEQWQPLLQNAFIVIAAVVVVEGLSALFFGG